ncbi:hypothetical protein AB0395_09190 [Streptosporangium sp. NPDC051023]|uniref:hypothetical protein n=1 Tax=Streptosporangium sp. NPDC051023 TaxID=3155410 RepID=UPI003450EFDE
MELHPESPIRHDPNVDERPSRSTAPGSSPEDALRDLPRMFALVQGGDDEETVAEVVAYGLALPGGMATTVGTNGHGFGLWLSADSAAWRLRSDLIRLGEDADEARPSGTERPLS